MKFSEIANLKEVELRKKLGEIRKELFELRMKKVVQKIPNPLLIRKLKKDRSRLMTALSQFKIRRLGNERSK